MQKESNRPRRVAELLKRELALIIPRELGHPLAYRITLTHAEAPRDMSSVKIYFTLLDGAAAAKEATKVLNHAAGFSAPRAAWTSGAARHSRVALPL